MKAVLFALTLSVLGSSAVLADSPKHGAPPTSSAPPTSGAPTSGAPTSGAPTSSSSQQTTIGPNVPTCQKMDPTCNVYAGVNVCYDTCKYQMTNIPGGFQFSIGDGDGSNKQTTCNFMTLQCQDGVQLTGCRAPETGYIVTASCGNNNDGKGNGSQQGAAAPSSQAAGGAGSGSGSGSGDGDGDGAAAVPDTVQTAPSGPLSANGTSAAGTGSASPANATSGSSGSGSGRPSSGGSSSALITSSGGQGGKNGAAALSAPAGTTAALALALGAAVAGVVLAL